MQVMLDVHGQLPRNPTPDATANSEHLGNSAAAGGHTIDTPGNVDGINEGIVGATDNVASIYRDTANRDANDVDINKDIADTAEPDAGSNEESVDKASAQELRFRGSSTTSNNATHGTAESRNDATPSSAWYTPTKKSRAQDAKIE